MNYSGTSIIQTPSVGPYQTVLIIRGVLSSEVVQANQRGSPASLKLLRQQKKAGLVESDISIFGILVWYLHDNPGWMDHLHDRGSKVILAFFCCYGNKNFFNNANGRSNHHAKFEIFLSYYWFYKNPRSKPFSHRFVLRWLLRPLALFKKFLLP